MKQEIVQSFLGKNVFFLWSSLCKFQTQRGGDPEYGSKLPQVIVECMRLEAVVTVCLGWR